MARPMGDVIVLLPGIMGSVLQKDGTDVWSPSIGAITRGIFSLGGRLRDLELTSDDVDDGVVATDVMPNVHLIPGFWKIDGYSTIRNYLHQRFELRDGENYFEFPYDWRRDVRSPARQLEKQSGEWLRRWREWSGNSDAKLVLIGHSMGGLVARHYLEVLGGWRDTRSLITFGTPFGGSINALETLVEGVRKGPRGFIDLTDAVRSFPSVYQLLPTYPAYDPGDGNFVRVGEVDDIPNLDPVRASEALGFHREIANQMGQHLDEDDYRENGYRMFRIVGIKQPTKQSARLADDKIDFSREYRGDDQLGDGTVPAVSAREAWISEDNYPMYCSTKHASLQSSNAILTQLSGVIHDLYFDPEPFRDVGPLGMRQTTVPKGLGLEVDDVYWHDEPVAIRLIGGEGEIELSATISDAETGEKIVEQPVSSTQADELEATFAPLPPGAYRVAISGASHPEPIEDVFVVFEEGVEAEA